jgi:hypothetical protein
VSSDSVIFSKISGKIGWEIDETVKNQVFEKKMCLFRQFLSQFCPKFAQNDRIARYL